MCDDQNLRDAERVEKIVEQYIADGRAGKAMPAFFYQEQLPESQRGTFSFMFEISWENLAESSELLADVVALSDEEIAVPGWWRRMLDRRAAVALQ